MVNFNIVRLTYCIYFSASKEHTREIMVIN